MSNIIKKKDDPLTLLNDAFSRTKKQRDESAIMRIGRMIEDEADGFEGIAREIIEDRKTVRNAGKDNLAYLYNNLFFRMAQARDEQAAALDDMGNIDPEDLNAIVSQIAVKLIAENSQFREHVLGLVLSENPLFLETFEDEQLHRIEVQHGPVSDSPPGDVQHSGVS